MVKSDKKIQGAADVEFVPNAEVETEAEVIASNDDIDEQVIEGLNAHDLVVAVNVITAASQRGAIRPDEMEVVGATYNKLVKFLTDSGIVNQSGNQEEANEEEEENV